MIFRSHSLLLAGLLAASGAAHAQSIGLWSAIGTATTPSSRTSCQLVFDPVRSRTFMAGGIAPGNSQQLNEFWEFDGTDWRVPSLTVRNASRPFLGVPFRLRFANLPPSPLSPVFACIGFDDQQWNGTPLPFDATAIGLTGCSLRIAPLVIDQLPNQNGIADWDIPIPIAGALEGAVFFVQGVVLANGVNPGGALLCDSGRGVIGSI